MNRTDAVMGDGPGLGNIGEFGLIQLLSTRAKLDTKRDGLGIGDDCALICAGSIDNDDLLVTTDALVERVHFLRDKISARQLGYKSLAVSVSDVAAMGGAPVSAFLSLGLTQNTDRVWVDAFGQGFMECAREFGVDLLGGDTVGSKKDIFINVTLIGKCKSERSIRRDGAKAGDCIYLGRPTGDSAAGLHLLLHDLSNVDEQDASALLAAHLSPRPQVQLGLLLSGQTLASAMIDVSDGLLQDLEHICKASGLGAELDLDSLPVSAQSVRLGQSVGINPLDWALSGGEDYCLLFCVHPGMEKKLHRLCEHEIDTRIYEIGKMVPGQDLQVIKNGVSIEILSTGHDHFSSYPSD